MGSGPVVPSLCWIHEKVRLGNSGNVVKLAATLEAISCMPISIATMPSW